MPGVVQELDLLLNKASVDKTVSDAQAAGTQIGTAFSKPGGAVTDLQRKTLEAAEAFRKAGVPAELLNETLKRSGFLTAEAAQGIAEVGKAASAASMNMAALSTTSGRIAVTAINPMTAAMSQAAAQTVGVSTTATRSIPGLNAMRSAMTSLASQAAGVPGPLGRVISLFLQCAGGSTLVLGVAAGVGLIALAWNKFTEATRKAREETTKFFENMRQENAAALPDQVKLQNTLAETATRVAALTAEFAQLEAIQQAAGAPAGEITKRMKEIIRDLETAHDGLRRLREEALRGVIGSASLSPGSGHGGTSTTIGGAEEERRAAAAMRDREKAAAELLKRQKELAEVERELSQLTNQDNQQNRQQLLAFADEQERLEKEEGTRQQQLADQRTELMGQLRRQLAGTTATAVDDLELELHDLQVKIIATFGSVPAELQPLLDDYRKRIQAAKDETGKAADPVKDLGTDWEKVGDTVATVAQGILDMARGLDLVNEGTEKVLQGMISLGKNLPKALTGDPGAIIGAVGGVVSIVGGLVGGGKGQGRLRTNQQLYNAAMEGDTGSLDRLLQLSGHGDAGNGWAKQDARDDAWTLYQAARANQTKREKELAAPEEAEKFRRLQRQEAEQRHRDLITIEERDLAARDEREQATHAERVRADIDKLPGQSATAGKEVARLQQLLDTLEKTPGAAGSTQWKNIIDQLKAAQREEAHTSESTAEAQKAMDQYAQAIARAIAEEGGELGKESPKAIDARREAEEHLRDAEQALDKAKQEAEALVSPGFTVQRTFTESSAGRIVGELTSQTVWLEKIYGALSGRSPTGAPTDGVSGGRQPVQVFLDGKMIADVVGEHQYASAQDGMARQGNALMA